MRAPMRLVVLGIAAVYILLSLCNTVHATHFAYGDINFARPCEDHLAVPAVGVCSGSTPYNYIYKVTIQQAWRRTFSSCWGSRGGPGSCDIEDWRNQPLTIDISGKFRYKDASTGDSIASHDIWLDVTSAYDGFLDYFAGIQVEYVDLERIDRAVRVKWDVNCCRLSTLENGNADDSWGLIMNIGAFQTASPSTNSVPRIYLAEGVPVNYVIPAVSPQGRALVFDKSDEDDSELTTSIPPDMIVDANTGALTWIPPEHNEVRLYAVQFRISDGYSDIPLDFIFQAGPPCESDCPYFIPDTPQDYEFFRGVERSIIFTVATDLSGETAFAAFGTPPPGATIQKCQTQNCNPPPPYANEPADSDRTSYMLRWTPALDATSATLCINAFDSQGQVRVGAYCPNLLIKPADVIYVSGIIRDFHSSTSGSPYIHPDFDRGETNADDTTNFVLPTLGPDRKPQFDNTVSTTSTSESTFYDWFHDSNYTTSLVKSTTLSNGTREDDIRIYTFFSSEYYPIDDRGFGNEGDTHNRWFTYEIEAYITYKTGMELHLSSSDDMWLFIDNQLPANWDMHGIHGPRTHIVDLDTFQRTDTTNLVPDETYRVNIFYADRSGANPPEFKLELPVGAFCNAISSGTEQFDITAFNNPLQVALVGSSPSLTNDKLRVMNAASTSNSGAAWFAEDGAARGLKVLNGFETEFDFQITNVGTSGCEGFAFVLQYDSPGARGGEGENLGYATILNSIAVEFDARANVALGDPDYQDLNVPPNKFGHVSVHTRWEQQNHASESFRLGEYSNNDPNMRLDNGTVHHVRIQYSPALEEGTGPQLGWLYVYMNEVIAPVVEVQVDGQKLADIFSTGVAYVGFTAGSGETSTCDIDILNWNLTIVPPSAEESYITSASPIGAVPSGTVGSVQVQTRDACQNNIKVGNEQELFSAYLEPTSGIHPLRLNATVTGNNDGTYTVSYAPTLAGTYNLYIRFDGVLIGNMPYQLTVSAGPVDPAMTRYFIGQNDYAPDQMGGSNGWVGMSWHADTGANTSEPVVFTDAASMASWVNGRTTGELVAVALGNDGFAVTGALETALSDKLGATMSGSIGAAQSYVLVGMAGSPGTLHMENMTAGVLEQAVTFPQTSHRVVEFRVQARSVENTYNLGPLRGAYVGLFFSEAASTGAEVDRVIIESRDANGNVRVGSNDIFAVSFQPDLTTLGGSVTVSDGAFGGLYLVELNSPAAGPYEMYIKYGASNIADSPGSAFIFAGPAYFGTSSAEGAALLQSVAGKASEFTLLPRDADNNLITRQVPSDIITGTITLQESPFTVHPLGLDRSSFTMNYTVEVSGTYLIDIVVNGESIDRGGATTAILAADIDAASCLALGDGVVGGGGGYVSAGSSVSFTVQARDEYGNDRLIPNPSPGPFQASIQDDLAAPVTATVNYESQGQYLVQYTPTRAQTHQATVQFDSVDIGTPAQPMSISVRPGPSHTDSIFHPVNPTTVTAGSNYTFVIEAYDGFGNPRVLGGEPGDFSVRVVSTPVQQYFGVSDIANSTDQNYTVQWSATVKGDYDIEVKVVSNNLPVENSPRSVTVVPAATDGPSCSLQGSALDGGPSLTLATIDIVARDVYGNQQDNDSDEFSVAVDGTVTNTSVPAGGNSGVYTLSYFVPNQATQTNFTLHVYWKNATGHDVLIYQKDNAVVVDSGLQSFAVVLPGSLSAQLKAGASHNFIIENRDNGGSPVTGVDFFTTEIYQPPYSSGDFLINSVTPGGPGVSQYTVSFVPEAVGNYEVRLYEQGVVQDENSKTTPETFLVIPGDPSHALSVVDGLPAVGDDAKVAGTVSTVWIQLRDEFNHIINDSDTRGISVWLETTVELQVLRWNATFVGMYNGTDGWFSASFNMTQAGLYAFSVFESVDPATVVGGGLFNVLVKHDEIDVASCTEGPITQGLELAEAGTEMTFQVSAFDRWGNPITAQSNVFNISFGSDPVAVSHVDRGNGVHSFYYTPYVANETQRIHVTLAGSGQPIPTSPFTLFVQPGPLNTTSASVLGLTSGVAGEDLSFQLYLEDVFGNPWQAGVSQVNLVQVFTSAPALDGGVGNFFVATVDAIGGLTGLYNITLPSINLRVAGVYNITFFASGEELVSAQRSVSIVAADADAEFTILPASLPQSLATVDNVFQIQLHDRFGNPRIGATEESIGLSAKEGSARCVLTDELETVVSPLNEANPGVFTFSTLYLGDGWYNVTYRSTDVGAFSLNLTVNGQELRCDKWVRLTLDIVAGPAHASFSKYSGGASSVVAGVPMSLTVQLRDTTGNPTGRGGTAVYLAMEASGGGLPPAHGNEQIGLSNDPNQWVSDNAQQGQTASITDNQDGTYTVDLVMTKIGTFDIVLSVYQEADGLVWLFGLENGAPKSITVEADVAASFVLPGSIDVVAGIPYDFLLQGTDQYDNPVSSDIHSYDINYLARDSGNAYAFQGLDTSVGDGVHQVDIFSTWHGDFDASYTVQPFGSTQLGILTVGHATCGYLNATHISPTPYRCPDGECASSYAACTNTTGMCTNPAFPHACAHSDACKASPLQCPCPGNRPYRCLTTGACVANETECLLAPECPADFPHRCVVGGVNETGACRKSAADCPSETVCPPGYFLCSDGLSCERTRSACTARVEAAPLSCARIGFRTCADGSCVRSFEDCPTVVTCPAGMVRCGTDGQCADDHTACAQQFDCHSPATFRCPGQGAACRDPSGGDVLAKCPTQLTCPLGWVKCESGRCASALSKCRDVAARRCPLNRVRCVDGACRHNVLHCPSSPTCPPDQSVRCPDGSCVPQSTDCAAPVSCPATVDGVDYLDCPDGSCLAGLTDYAQCPYRTTCPEDHPVLCNDGSCQTDSDQCPVLAACPPSAPLRCPNGGCRAALADCSTISVCPERDPVRCLDGRCVASSEQCADVALVSCEAGKVRCPGGECAGSISLCPTHVTCPAGTVRCADGTCRGYDSEADYYCPPTAEIVQSCPGDTILCPQAAVGRVCADSLASCPQSVVCPVDRPVKCQDASCAATQSACPPPPTDDYTESRVACPDGSFQSGTCPTIVTCPPSAPFKCFDQTCRVSPTDCPDMPSCPTATPYLCPNGACVTLPWDNECLTQATVCDPATPIKCPDAPDSCVADLAECPEVFTDVFPDGVVENSFDNPATVIEDNQFCAGSTWVRCRDGSCAKLEEVCEEMSCGVLHRCDTGECVADPDRCPLENGCPWNLPVKCWNGACVNAAGSCPPLGCATGLIRCPWDGSCVNDANDCLKCPDGVQFRCWNGDCVTTIITDPLQEPGPNDCPRYGCGLSQVLCPDGTCQNGLSECRSENNCPAGYRLCADQSCVPYDPQINYCVSGASHDRSVRPANACPAQMPYRCTNGFCAASSTLCPTVSSAGCPSETPFRCAQGDCVAASGECSLIVPCAPGLEARCPNGACRPLPNPNPPLLPGSTLQTTSSFCPFVNTCPEFTPYRCFNGLCAEEAALCIDPLVGCPVGYDRCENGACVPTDNVNVTCTTVSDLVAQVANGCPVDTPYKCHNGACVSNIDTCPLANNCPPSTPHRCVASGVCVAAPSLCGAQPACTGFVCADGSCEAAAANCTAVNGCPVTAPIRCASGECRKYPAGQGTGDSCPLVITCSDGAVQCENGACVAEASVCTPALACPDATPVRCADQSCAESAAMCTESAQCPSSAPVLCANGECRASSRDCTSTMSVTVTCVDPNPVLCFDGSCRASQTECLDWVSEVNGELLSSPDVCQAGETLCWDGSCVVGLQACASVMPACPADTYRCSEGECANATCTLNSCPVGTVACPDGFCRAGSSVAASCPGYDGCPVDAPFHCDNRECAMDSSGCAAAAQGSAPWAATAHRSGSVASMRRAEQVSFHGDGSDDTPWWCHDDCLAAVKATAQNITFDPSTAPPRQSFAVASEGADVHVQLDVLSGSIQYHPSVPVATVTSIVIRPVPDSRMRDAVNRVHRSRLGNPKDSNGDPLGNFNEFLTFPQTVLSPAFECVTDTNTVVEPFPIPMETLGTLDLPTNLRPEDVCFAQLEETYQESLGISFWQCVEPDLIFRADPNLRSLESIPVWQTLYARGHLTQCGPGTVYAWVYAPLPASTATQSNEGNWLEENLVLVLFGGLALAVVLFGVLYCAKRLHRYRKKYHRERAAVNQMKQEVEDMNQFGGSAGTKDEEVHYVANPLVMQIRELQDEMDEKKQAIRQEERKAAKRESDMRQAHIDNLRSDKDSLEEELKRLQGQLRHMQDAQRNAGPRLGMDLDEDDVPPSIGSPLFRAMDSDDSDASSDGEGIGVDDLEMSEFTAKRPGHRRQKSLND